MNFKNTESYSLIKKHLDELLNSFNELDFDDNPYHYDYQTAISYLEKLKKDEINAGEFNDLWETLQIVMGSFSIRRRILISQEFEAALSKNINHYEIVKKQLQAIINSGVADDELLHNAKFALETIEDIELKHPNQIPREDDILLDDHKFYLEDLIEEINAKLSYLDHPSLPSYIELYPEYPDEI